MRSGCAEEMTKIRSLIGAQRGHYCARSGITPRAPTGAQERPRAPRSAWLGFSAIVVLCKLFNVYPLEIRADLAGPPCALSGSTQGQGGRRA